MNALAEKYFDLLEEVARQDALSPADRFPKLRTLTDRWSKELTRQEPVALSSLFARIDYLSQFHQLPRELTGQLHRLRIMANQALHEGYVPSLADFRAGVGAMARAIAHVGKEPLPLFFQSFTEWFQLSGPPARAKGERLPCVRVEVLEKKDKLSPPVLICHDQASDEPQAIQVRFAGEHLVKHFENSFRLVRPGQQLNLLDVLVCPDGAWEPDAFIIEPDFLMDASAIAECFGKYNSPFIYLVNKFRLPEPSVSLLVGNIVNYFLDELMNQHPGNKEDFKTRFPHTFRLNPLGYTALKELEDSDKFKAFADKLERQHTNLEQVVENGLAAMEIGRETCYLEPAFFSEQFGIQGRLDLFSRQPAGRNFLYQIVELKSSSQPPSPGLGPGMWLNHEVQATLYRLLVQSVFEVGYNRIRSFILYSADEQNPLRYLPSAMGREREALNMRNQLAGIELFMASAPAPVIEAALSKWLHPQAAQEANAPKFTTENFQVFTNAWEALTPAERRYLALCFGFVAREFQLARIGDTEWNKGLSALWADPFTEKAANFEILFDLQLVENHADQPLPTLVFRRANPENDFVNFRQGDIGVLYPRSRPQDSVLRNQIFKGSIAHISQEQVVFQLRARQSNRDFFDFYDRWAIEHDVIDRSFQNMYEGMSRFMHSPAAYRSLLLGFTPPAEPAASAPEVAFTHPNMHLREEEARILQKAFFAPHYFLLVGPPGTGKTSRMLHNLVRLYWQHTTDNVLLLAYTNRAVDEICEAVAHALKGLTEEETPFIRLGSELSTAPEWHPYLLERIARQAPRRTALKQAIGQCRIFIGTVASLNARPELMSIKRFQVAMVDEASQILEPQLMGILTQVRKFILIGDEKQLPAVVVQPPEQSACTEDGLYSIGLYNLRNSYFERMLLLAKQKQWHWAWDTLTHQGRMHEQIARIPNEFFYGGLLQLAAGWQSETTLPHACPQPAEGLEQLLSANRILFFPSRKENMNRSDKMHHGEALLVVELLLCIQQMYQKAGKEFLPTESVGVITPYRNQIAHIRHEMEKRGIENHQLITVDTVERYQGSQRDIILYSFAVNSLAQADLLPSLTEDGTVDRKLNVALTRARQQLILTGCEAILNRQPVFKRLFEDIQTHGGYVPGWTADEKSAEKA